ncbi:MAG: hypothetical protein Q7R87_03685 [Nanoarchaeota archaeon]|nr:hypothetical protein [Nanoarchaeota archaeon]
MLALTTTRTFRDGGYSSDSEFLPLRISRSGIESHLCSPYDFCEDKSALGILEEDSRIAYLELNYLENNSQLRMFFSHTSSSILVTASGYSFEGPVKVSSWKVDSGREIDPSERQSIGLLANVNMLHVMREDKIVKADFNDTLGMHKQRLRETNARSISLKEAFAFYQAMQHHVTRF